MPSENRYLQGLKGFGAKARGVAGQTHSKLWDQYWPTIAQVLRERVGQAAVKVAGDDEKLTNLARTAYAPLPLAFRLFVNEAEFVTFCLANRNRLLLSKETSPEKGEERDILPAEPPLE